jgi:hypothetical protein
MVEGLRAWLGDPRAVMGSRGVSHPREVDETYPGDDGRRLSCTA